MQNWILIYGNQYSFSKEYLKDHLATNTALYSTCNSKISNPLKSLQQQIQAKKATVFFLWNRNRARIRRKWNSYTQNQAAFLFQPPATICEQRIIIISAANAVSLFCFWKLYSHNDPVIKDFSVLSIKRIAHNRKCCCQRTEWWHDSEISDFVNGSKHFCEASG